MKRLHYKLSVAMLAIIGVLGAAFYLIERHGMRLYYEEVTQRLNSSLAMYIANAEPLISAGEVNSAALKDLASRAMVINPTAEIYLLDTEGQILGFALDPEDVKAQSVDLGPIQELLSAATPLPITGSNPRAPGTQKVFSAFPVSDSVNGLEAGYLYVVLGGSQYDAIVAQVFGGYRQRILAAGVMLIVAGACVAGVLLFGFLTRRLRRLTTEVTTAAESGFGPDTSLQPAAHVHDEIDQLRNACSEMVSTIQQQLANIQEDERLRRELITNISHDLRTPLASMQGYIETLLIKDEELDQAGRQRYLEIARKHAAHLGKLIQDLFELTMLDANRVVPKFEEFGLTELIYDVVQEFELHAAQAEVALTVDPPKEEVFVFADISLIQRVLENLVGNALKHTPAGGRVTISAAKRTGSVGVSVADTGKGIPDEALPYIFDRFFQGESDAGYGDGSVGLGLAIAKRILELHNTTIHVTSEPESGTRFDFDLFVHASAA